MTDAENQMKTPFPPQTPCPFELAGDEQHVHTLLLRGYRYAPALPAPIHENYTAHLTTRRIILLPIEPDRAPDSLSPDPLSPDPTRRAGTDLAPAPGPISLPWNDVIEIRTAAGSRLPDTLPGAEEHMLLIEARSREAQEFAEMFLFTVEPLAGARPAERPAHGIAFVDRVEELLLDAFEA